MEELEDGRDSFIAGEGFARENGIMQAAIRCPVPDRARAGLEREIFLLRANS